MNTKSIFARCGSLARSKKAAALLLLACTVGSGEGGAVGATVLAVSSVFVTGTVTKILFDGSRTAATTAVRKQGQATETVGGGASGR
jgi:hypothetical protein